MIKASGINKQGVPQVWLGLSDMNWEKLRAGQPIHINLRKDLHVNLPDMDIVLLGGISDSDIVQDLRSVGAKTE